jgi:amino acid transporter
MLHRNLFRKKSIPAIMREAESGLSDGEGHREKLARALSVRDLTFFGIAAVIGTGVFTAIGKASFDGGPAVILLFAFTAIACAFAAYCYAEFASTVPISGSAYTYSYVAFGELFAWIIGWDLLMEYAIGNIAVAISWSQYFVRVLEYGFHFDIPRWLTMDYFTAKAGFNEAAKLISDGTALQTLDEGLRNKYAAWQSAPMLGNLRLIMNLPALLIVGFITWIVYIGIRESKRANNIMVGIKLGVIVLVIIAGAFYIDTSNWTDFMPKGFKGVLAGVSAVFFAYIGFDAISTTAEECKNPQRDLPRAMFNTLIICTTLYIILVLVLTGMAHYTKLNVADPLAFVFQMQNSAAGSVIAGVVSVSAIFVIASVLLVYQLGQPRIWMSMSRDGLLPKIFSRIHPKYKTPSFSTILTGFVVAIPALFLNLDVVISLSSIGTLFAFVLVCGGVLVLQNQPNRPESKFKVPYINGRFIVPILFLMAVVIVTMAAPEHWANVFGSSIYFSENARLILGETSYRTYIGIGEGFPMLIFWIVTAVVTVFSYIKNFSLIPVFGLVSCFYLMSQESHTNWLRFFIWLIVGLILYFFYGYKNSKLHTTPNQQQTVNNGIQE